MGIIFSILKFKVETVVIWKIFVSAYKLYISTNEKFIRHMKMTILIALIIFNINCYGQKSIVPNGFKILVEKLGDLDKDGISEKVIVYNTTDTTEAGIVRELQILKRSKGNWIMWKKSRNAILKSEEGGMMGNPFEDIEIDKGILIISFSGGSSWKWFYKDKYKFKNNEFEMIGYSNIYGKPCEYWTDVDFNLSTGKIIFKKEFEDCEKNQEVYKKQNEIFYRKNILINLNNRNLKEIKIISPRYKHQLYL